MPAALQMPDPIASEPTVAVIGAGITGLAAAHRLVELRPSVRVKVFEAAAEPGGVLQTTRRDRFLVERSADNFLTKMPWAINLCRRVGIGEELLPTDERRRRALVVCRGRVLPTPEGFLLMTPRRFDSVLRSPILSFAGKLRICCEPFIRRRGAPNGEPADESVASFARRRLGREAFERLVQPLLSGIYTADPEKLSMAATMPQFLEQERDHGSLCRAAWAERGADDRRESGARYSLFQAPRGGMRQLVDAVVSRLPQGALRTATPVGSVTRSGDQWVLQTEGGEPLGRFGGVVITAQAYRAAEMLRGDDALLASELGEIEYAGCSVVCLAFRKAQIPTELDGFGFVVPSIERRKVIAVSFASLKFPGRAPDDAVLFRAFVGGALQPELAQLEEGALRTLVTDELRGLIGIQGEPLFLEVARWPRGMPQYHVGHVERVARLEGLLSERHGLEIAGAAYRGVGIPQCIRDGEQAAERILDQLRPTPA